MTDGITPTTGMGPDYVPGMPTTDSGVYNAAQATAAQQAQASATTGAQAAVAPQAGWADRFFGSSYGEPVLGGLVGLASGQSAGQVATGMVSNVATKFLMNTVGNTAVKALTSKFMGMLGAKLAGLAASGLVSFGITTVVGLLMPYAIKLAKKIYKGLKSLFGGGNLRKAKKNFDKEKKKIEKRLIDAGVPPEEARKAAANQAYQMLPETQKTALWKAAQENPNGQSIAILREAGVDKNPNYIYTPPNDQIRKLFTDFDATFTSDANTQERVNAKSERDRIIAKYGVINKETLAKYFRDDFTYLKDGVEHKPSTQEEWQAALMQKGYGISVELVDEKFKSQSNISMPEKIAAYAMSSADTATHFNSTTFRMEKNDELSEEEFIDIFDIPDRASMSDNGVLDKELDPSVGGTLDTMDELNNLIANNQSTAAPGSSNWAATQGYNGVTYRPGIPQYNSNWSSQTIFDRLGWR